MSFTPEFRFTSPKKGIFVQGNLIKLWSCLTSTCYFRLWTFITQNKKKKRLESSAYHLQPTSPKKLLYNFENSPQKDCNIPSLHVFSRGNFGATLKMVPNVPPFFPYCFPCVKWSPSHDFFMVMSPRGKESGNVWLQAPQRAITLPFEAQKGDNLAPFPGNSRQLKGYHLPSDDASVCHFYERGQPKIYKVI